MTFDLKDKNSSIVETKLNRSDRQSEVYPCSPQTDRGGFMNYSEQMDMLPGYPNTMSTQILTDSIRENGLEGGCESRRGSVYQSTSS